MKSTLTILVVLLVILAATAPAKADIRSDTRWADPDRVQLNVTFPGNGYHASWDVFRCDCGDLLVKSELAVPGESVAGDLVLIENRAVLSRGFGKYQAEAAASLDAAALMLQLALRLLERSEPGGPSKITESTTIDLTDDINPILLDSGGAMGGFQPPWSVQGVIKPGQGKQRRFDLQFSFTAVSAEGSQQGSMRLHGWADFTEIDFPIAAESDLEGWNLDWRDPQDAAVPEAGKANSLADLRRLIKAN